MSIGDHKTKIVFELEENLENGHNIIIYNLKSKDLLKNLCDAINSNCKQDYIEIWCSIKYLNNQNIKIVSPEELNEIVDLYHLYEFTDKLLILTDNPNYPVLMNYVSQGIITEREMMEAFTYKL